MKQSKEVFDEPLANNSIAKHSAFISLYLHKFYLRKLNKIRSLMKEQKKRLYAKIVAKAWADEAYL